jgi:formylglycine-generating enzyme required for sulfatase activity
MKKMVVLRGGSWRPPKLSSAMYSTGYRGGAEGKREFGNVGFRTCRTSRLDTQKGTRDEVR